MSLLTTLLAQTASLADSSDATYEEATYTNSGSVQVGYTLEVVTLLDVLIVDGTIATVTFAARAGKTTDGTWTQDRIRFYQENVVEPGISAVVSIPTTLAGIGDVDSGAQATAPDTTPWTWQHLIDTTVVIESDVTLDPGESATLRVSKVTATVDGTAAAAGTTTINGWRAWPSTKVVT